MERGPESSLELSTSFSCQMEGLFVAMLGGKIELGWLVPNKMLYLILLWETFDVRTAAIREIYLRRSVLLEQQTKESGGWPQLGCRFAHRNVVTAISFSVLWQLLTVG